MEETAKDYPEVEVSYMYVDNCAMQLVRNPNQFDTIVTSNIFGDILSDEASMISGSIGMLASASLAQGTFGLYEPIHGSAPDIAGQGKANPLATILSGAMMLRYTFDEAEAATLSKMLLTLHLPRQEHLIFMRTALRLLIPLKWATLLQAFYNYNKN